MHLTTKPPALVPCALWGGGVRVAGMKTLHAFTQFVVLVSLPLLLGGCGGDKKEPVAESKPAEAVSVSPHLKYEIKDGTVTISRCDRKALGTITIPATIEGNPVTSIGLQAFSGCRGLTSITIPDSVTTIGVRAISFCTNLTSITIPDSITSIGDSAFSRCRKLTAVTFLGDAPKAGEKVFEDATPTIYRKSEAKGWGKTWWKRPVKLISEKP